MADPAHSRGFAAEGDPSDEAAKAARRTTPIRIAALLCWAIPCMASAGTDPPLPAIEVSLAGYRLLVEVAGTAAEKVRGLMYRSALPEGRGMLFPYEPPAPVSFWMKGVRFPLDLLFFDRRGCLIAHHDRVPPCASAPCPSYPGGDSTSWVLEVPAGTRQRLSIVDGDCVLDLTP